MSTALNPPSGGSWIEIAVQVAGIDAEIAADLFRQACPGGAAIETPSRLDTNTDIYVPDGDAIATVTGYLAPGPDAERAQASLRLALQAAPLQRPPAWRKPRLIKDEDWRDSWKKHFGVQRISNRLVIAPSWIVYRLKRDETVIRIDPGMAFGTGQHPTTAMCLRALEELIHRGDDVLDLGCGSGILGIAAALLDAGSVLALDTDEQAVKATRENAEANGVAGVISAREGTLDPGPGHFDVIAANISGLALKRLAPEIAGSLKPGGVLIASGFLDDAVSEVSESFTNAGLTIERVVEEGVWRTIIAARPTGA
jgi:ribosomal protein L11 methyltransferase